jgi:hypothetical protein
VSSFDVCGRVLSVAEVTETSWHRKVSKVITFIVGFEVQLSVFMMALASKSVQYSSLWEQCRYFSWCKGRELLYSFVLFVKLCVSSDH